MAQKTRKGIQKITKNIVTKSEYVKAAEVKPGHRLHLLDADGNTTLLKVKETYPLTADRLMIVTEGGPVQAPASANVYVTREVEA